jgi:hypothetical protein
MAISLTAILVLASLIMTLVHAARPSYVPLWVPVLVLTVALLVQFTPINR